MAADSASAHDAQGPRFLILDDSPQDARLVCEMLRDEGLDGPVDVVGERASFLQALSDHAYDLILGDYRLPGFNGQDALEIARQTAPETPFIVVSGAIGEETAVDLLKQGAADYVLKDRLGRLPSAIRRALDAARGEAALAEVNSQAVFLADIIERADQAIAVGYPDGRIGFFNAAFCGLTGYSADELRAITWRHDLTPPEWRLSEQKVLAELVRTGRPQRYEKEYVRKDGSRVPLELLTHVVRDERGEPKYYYAFITDITERKRAEEVLRESEERLALTLEVTNDGMWDWNLRTGDVVFSPRYYTMLGYKSYEFPQSYDAWRELVHRWDLRGVERKINSAIENGDGFATTMRLRTKAGGWCWILARGKVVERDAEGRAVRLVGTNADVTELRQAERAAAERAHFLEELLEAIPVPVFYKDTALRFVGCNEAFAASFGRSRDEIIGKTVFDVHPADIAESFEASDRELLAHPEEPYESEVDVPGLGGGFRSILAHKAVYSGVSGKPAGIVGVYLDVTEIRQAARELVTSAVQLQLTLKAAVAALGATTEMRDPYTAGHQRRVAELACAIAAELGWQQEQIETLRTAALLHDIGKIVVPAEILSKPGRLTENEMALIREHAAAGASTVADIDFGEDIAEIIRQHHERLDGTGYPAGLRGDQILPEARILAIADVVEAMVSHRPYRPRLPLEDAIAELEDGAGTRYDATMTRACVRLFREKGFAFAD